MANLKKFNKSLQYILAFFIFIQLITPTSTFSQANGEKIFMSVCRACHTIGEGKLVGPDLANVQNRFKQDWLIKWIKSSQTLVKSGDSEAVKIFNTYKIPMPDNALTDAQIIEVLNYIKAKSPVIAGTEKVKPTEFKIKNELGFNFDEAGKEEFEIGLQYFTGKKKFENSGTPCIACHNVVKDNLISGGLLAKDLTSAFSRLSASGVNSIISSPPFPIMKTAFNDKPLTKNEKYYLLAFLKHSDFVAKSLQPENHNVRFLSTGIVGVIFLFGIFGLVWFTRKKDCVKKEIFKRQLNSK